ncbi:hypothetical protein CAPTEDRAFT_188919, partial [Capitella teleta]
LVYALRLEEGIDSRCLVTATDIISSNCHHNALNRPSVRIIVIARVAEQFLHYATAWGARPNCECTCLHYSYQSGASYHLYQLVYALRLEEGIDSRCLVTATNIISSNCHHNALNRPSVRIIVIARVAEQFLHYATAWGARPNCECACLHYSYQSGASYHLYQLVYALRLEEDIDSRCLVTATNIISSNCHHNALNRPSVRIIVIARVSEQFLHYATAWGARPNCECACLHYSYQSGASYHLYQLVYALRLEEGIDSRCLVTATDIISSNCHHNALNRPSVRIIVIARVAEQFLHYATAWGARPNCECACLHYSYQSGASYHLYQLVYALRLEEGIDSRCLVTATNIISSNCHHNALNRPSVRIIVIARVAEQFLHYATAWGAIYFQDSYC